jgi:hypothetical protein
VGWDVMDGLGISLCCIGDLVSGQGEAKVWLDVMQGLWISLFGDGWLVGGHGC